MLQVLYLFDLGESVMYMFPYLYFQKYSTALSFNKGLSVISLLCLQQCRTTPILRLTGESNCKWQNFNSKIADIKVYCSLHKLYNEREHFCLQSKVLDNLLEKEVWKNQRLVDKQFKLCILVVARFFTT